MTDEVEFSDQDLLERCARSLGRRNLWIVQAEIPGPGRPVLVEVTIVPWTPLSTRYGGTLLCGDAVTQGPQ